MYDSLTPVSKNHTHLQTGKNNKWLIINKIKVWHGICNTIVENEWITLDHGVMFLILMKKGGSFVAKCGFLTQKTIVKTDKNSIYETTLLCRSDTTTWAECQYHQDYLPRVGIDDEHPAIFESCL